MVYFFIFVLTLIVKEVVMAVYTKELGILENDFKAYNSVEKSLIFVTEIFPVLIIYYGIYVSYMGRGKAVEENDEDMLVTNSESE